jgi:diacylglycerol kinase (ATP)
MRVTLIHNPGAGQGGDAPDAQALARTIRAAGHEVTAISSHDPAWSSVLERPADLVAVHGGDGTIGRVARHMAGRGVPLAALAGGTANNIATTLGTDALPLKEQIDAWTGGRRIAFDTCAAHGPFGTRVLIEGFGTGLFAWAMHAEDARQAAPAAAPASRVAHGLSMLIERVAAHPPTRVQARLDGNDLSGDYVVFEAMNTQFIGPHLFLAPEAHPGDGLLDVVVVTDDARAQFREHLASWKRGALRPPPSSWPTHRGRHLELHWTGYPLHLDDESWPQTGAPPPQSAQRIEIEVQPGTLEFLVPADHPNPPVR